MDRQLPSSPPKQLSSAKESSVGKPSNRGKYLRALLTFFTEVGEAQLEQIPVFGPLLKGSSAVLQQLSEEEDQAHSEERIEQIFSAVELNRDKIDLLMQLSVGIFKMQSRQHEELFQMLLSHFERLGLTAEPRQLTEFAVTESLFAYRKRVAVDYLYADYRGIEGMHREGHAASLLMDDVYVMPRLFSEFERAGVREKEKDALSRLLDCPDDLSRDQRARLEEEYAAVTGERWRSSEKKEHEGLPLGKALESARHIVVIGSPGVGKSMMTRYLARTCALGEERMQNQLGWDEVLTPILLPLAAFADARSDPARRNISLRDFLNEKITERGGVPLREAIAEEFTQGKVFVMLDGIDEVADAAARVSVVRAVDQFIADHSSNRILVTSRPYGYIRLAGVIPHFQLSNFSSEQVSTFVKQWQRAFESWRRPNAPDIAAADKEADAMLEEINSNPKVSELAANPLMLVIISLIRLERAKLPEKRVQLYYRAVNTLMDTWNAWRVQGGYDLKGAQLPIEQLVRVWGAVAEWTRRNKPTGIIHRVELKRKLIEILEEKELDEDNAADTAESYLKAATNRAGLLEERGQDVFAFWHPTFEEFLAAVELATPTAKAIDRLLPLCDDPRWREVVLLAVGYVGVILKDPDTATAIVEAIVHPNNAGLLENIFHSRLRLAAAAVADNVGVKRTFAQQIILRLAEAIQTRPFRRLNNVFVETVRTLPALRPSKDTVAALAPLTALGNWEVRMEAARLFSNVAAENEEARALCELLIGESDPDVRVHAALGLARAGDYRDEVWVSLSRFESADAHIKSTVEEFFKSTPNITADLVLIKNNPNVCIETANLLHKMGKADERVVETLFSLLNDENARIRDSAASLLHQMGKADERVVETLFSLLNDENARIRDSAASLLHQMGKADERVVETLFSLLNAENTRIRDSAASLLHQMGKADERVVETLFSLLNDENTWTRYQAASLLHQMGKADERVVETLFSMLNDENAGTRYSAASLLHKMGKADERVVETLFSMLNDENAGTRYSAASLLHKMGKADERVVETLFSMLNDENAENAGTRYQAASLLQEMGKADERVVETLFSMLNDENAENARTRFQAASLLHKIGKADERVVETLFSLLNAENAENARTRFQAASLLHQMGKADERVVETLFSLLNAENAENARTRFQAASLLHQMGKADERVVETLFSMLNDENAENARTRFQAASLLQEMGKADERVVETLFSMLNDENAENARTRFQAASLLQEMGKADERVVETLFSMLNDENAETRFRGVILLQQMPKISNKVLESIVRIVQPETGMIMAICNSAKNKDQLTEADVKALDILFSAHSGDTSSKQFAREWLFNWFWDGFYTEKQSGFVIEP